MLRVGYEILVEVGVDAETGEILDVTAYPDGFNDQDPSHIFSNLDTTPDGYLEKTHPLYAWAVKQALKVEASAWQGVVPIPFVVSDDGS
jgi:hypothetical protein